MDDDQVDEFVQLYQRTSAQLSHVRTYYRDPNLAAMLTRKVAAASGVLYGKRARTIGAIGRFFRVSFPGAVWHHRRLMLIAAILTFAPALVIGIWLANSDAALDATAPAALREAYVNEEFEEYYDSENAEQFSTAVLVNNIQVSLLAFGAGVLLCVGTAYILVTNGANLGFAIGLFAAAGQQPRFWGLILPHGLLELTAIVIAGGAGLSLGWAIIAPGDKPRAQALAEEGRRSVAIIIGLMLVFIVAGLIEGYITGAPIPTAIRVGIGVLVEAAFLLYLFVYGPKAALEIE